MYDHLILVILFKNRHKDFFACLANKHALGRGPFNNYVDKMRWGGEGSKMSVFVHAQGIKTVPAGGEWPINGKFCPRSC